MFSHNFINAIEDPSYIFEGKTGKICNLNDSMVQYLGLESREDAISSHALRPISDMAIARLAENEAVVFREEALAKTRRIKCHKIGAEDRYVFVSLEEYEDNAIRTFDSYYISQVVPGGMMMVEIKESEYEAKYANNGMIKMLGYEREECREKFAHNVFGFVHPEDVEPSLKEFHRQIKISSEFNVSGRLIRKDESIIWVNVSGRRIQNDDGRVFIMVTVNDITREHELLEAVSINRQSKDILADISRNIVFTYNINDNTVSLSGGIIKKYTGENIVTYTKEELLAGRTFLEVDRESVSRAFRVMANKAKEEIIISAYNEKGQIFYFSTGYNYVYNHCDEVALVVGEIVNVTEQIESEQYYEQIFHHWTSDASEKDASVSLNLTRNTLIKSGGGLFEIGTGSGPMTRGDESLQIIIDSVVDAGERKALEALLDISSLIDKFENGNMSFIREEEVKVKDEHHWIQLSGSVIRNPRTKDLILMLKVINLDSVKLQRKVNQLLYTDSYDFVCCLFAKTDSYIMLENTEDNRIIPDSVTEGYEALVKDVIKKYSVPEEKEYLSFCFTLKNIKQQLSDKDVYSFTGHGFYPDGSPTVKYHRFSYIDKKNQVILYTRKDITNTEEELTVNTENVIRRIPFDDILYVESFGKRSCIVTKEQRVYVNEMISRIQSRLSGRKFIRCHRCYLLNYAAVKEISTNNCATVVNGDVVSISRKNISLLKERYK